MATRALHIFRRDLRLLDNTALVQADKTHDEVLPAFFFDPRQLDDHPYQSMSGMQFLFESLADLQQQLEKNGSSILYCHGSPEDRLATIIKKHAITTVSLNADYTPFSKQRDAQVAHICAAAGAKFLSCHDVLLHAPGDVVKDDGKPYTVYTPFSKKALAKVLTPPARHVFKNLLDSKGIKSETTLAEMYEKYLPHINERLHVRGGRKHALAILKTIPKLRTYATDRDFPAIGGTTGLSAHNKFGTVSTREVAAAVDESFGMGHTLIRELLWRDFFTHICYFFPHVFKGAFYQRYDSLEWDKPGKQFDAWRDGMTGFPLVDAGMRQLKETGYMHNRVRMVVASFLTKDLHISWREGEKHFARLLVDYDPAVNNGNWQWAASTGCDAQPYFRIFNPWLQQQRFDPDCEYCKHWVPELRNFTAKQIHGILKSKQAIPNYPAPIVEHSVEKTIAEKRYATAAALKKKT